MDAVPSRFATFQGDGDLELRVLRWIGHRIPDLPHSSAIVNRVIKPLYLRRPRRPVTCDVLGHRMALDVREAIDGYLVFCPHLYDPLEIRFLQGIVGPYDTVVDVGAHKGFYALMASRLVPNGRVVAIEADPETFQILQENIRLNDAEVVTVHRGVGDSEGVFTFHRASGNVGLSSFLNSKPGWEDVPVRSSPLLEIVGELGIERIRCLKIDVEGYEHRVLDRFFRDAPAGLHPDYIITEYYPGEKAASTGNQIELLSGLGYTEVERSRDNRILRGRNVSEGS